MVHCLKCGFPILMVGCPCSIARENGLSLLQLEMKLREDHLKKQMRDLSEKALSDISKIVEDILKDGA